LKIMNGAQKSFLRRSALGAAALFAVYITVMTLANSFAVALGELGRWWVYVTALSAGFGLQVGLYTHIRDLAKAGEVGFQGSKLAVGGGVSATSMVVCCLHHVTDVLPLVGFSAVVLFLADYQSVFMSLGVLSSIVGTIMMLEQLQSARAAETLSPRLGRLLAWYDVTRIRKVSFAAASLIFVVLLTGALGSQGVNAAPDSSTVVGSEAGVTFTVRSVEYDDAIGFQMKIDTHQGDLSFDLTEVSTLQVGGNVYEPLTWAGSPPGGHHRTGELVFPKPSEQGPIRLVIRDVYSVSERVFDFGGAPVASGNAYISLGVSGITIVALLIVYKSKRRPEEYYQSLFEAEQRSYRPTRSFT
jgi:hypothetical protein